MLLAGHLVEGLRAPLAGEDEVAHRSVPTLTASPLFAAVVADDAELRLLLPARASTAAACAPVAGAAARGAGRWAALPAVLAVAAARPPPPGRGVPVARAGLLARPRLRHPLLGVAARGCGTGPSRSVWPASSASRSALGLRTPGRCGGSWRSRSARSTPRRSSPPTGSGRSEARLGGWAALLALGLLPAAWAYAGRTLSEPLSAALLRARRRRARPGRASRARAGRLGGDGARPGGGPPLRLGPRRPRRAASGWLPAPVARARRGHRRWSGGPARCSARWTGPPGARPSTRSWPGLASTCSPTAPSGPLAPSRRASTCRSCWRHGPGLGVAGGRSRAPPACARRPRIDVPLAMAAVALLALLLATPHKEERFLYPVVVLLVARRRAGAGARSAAKATRGVERGAGRGGGRSLGELHRQSPGCARGSVPRHWSEGARPAEVTGLLIVNEGLWGAGGFFYVGKHIPWLTCDWPRDGAFRSDAGRALQPGGDVRGARAGGAGGRGLPGARARGTGDDPRALIPLAVPTSGGAPPEVRRTDEEERPGHTRRCATVASFRTWRGSRPRVVPTTSCCSRAL